MATGSISSAGIGSGLDVSSIVTQLMAVEKQPLTKLQTAGATIQTQISAFGQMQSAVSALRDAAAPLFNTDTFALTASSSSDPGSVSAGTTTKAQPGTYSVSVSALSAPQSIVSASGQFHAATDPVGTGSLTVRLGTWSGTPAAFAPKAGSSDITIPIGASDNTLAGVRDKINAANAGVTATLVTDASGSRIALQSTSAGAANGFRVTVSDDDLDNADSAGLSRLAYDPAGAAAQMTLAQSAANTEATINGIAVSSSSNTFSEVVDGMSFNVSKVTTAPVTVSVTRNTDAIKAQINKFVGAYNDLNGFLASATKFDAQSKQAALLQGDSTTVGIQNQLRALVGQPSGASTAFNTLSSLGVQLQKDGSLLVNDTKLTAALKNLPELAKSMSNVDATVPANNGFGKKFANWADQLLASGGSISGKTKSLQARLAENRKDQDKMTDRIAMTQDRLNKQYSALDSTMSSANALSKYVSQQITTWNKSTA